MRILRPILRFTVPAFFFLAPWSSAAVAATITSNPPPGIETVAGNGGTGWFSGDNGPATSASLNTPVGVAVDGAGNLFITDSWNNRVRRVDFHTGIITTVAGNGAASYSGDGGPATSAAMQVAGVMEFPASLCFTRVRTVIDAEAWFGSTDRASGLFDRTLQKSSDR